MLRDARFTLQNKHTNSVRDTDESSVKYCQSIQFSQDERGLCHGKDKMQVFGCTLYITDD